MNRAIFLLLIVMLLGAQTLLAQRGRGRHGGAGQTSQSPGAQPDNGDMGDFKRAVALQATEDQTSQFRSMLRKTGSTQKQALEFLDSVAKANDFESLKGQVDLLGLAIDDVQQGDKEFLQSFSDPQKSGLKKFIKPVRKSESDVTRQWKETAKALGEPAPDGKRVAGLVQQMNESLTTLQAEQKKLGAEMSIDLSVSEKAPQKPVLISP